jgi:hypothetical protein
LSSFEFIASGSPRLCSHQRKNLKLLLFHEPKEFVRQLIKNQFYFPNYIGKLSGHELNVIYRSMPIIRMLDRIDQPQLNQPSVSAIDSLAKDAIFRVFSILGCDDLDHALFVVQAV